MKLKSLFLASLAAIAMASCSNEVEGVDNGINNVEKNAKLQFSIGFASAVTRADGTTELGSDKENKVNTVNIRVVYQEGTADDVFNFAFPGDFAKADNNNVYTLNPDKLMEVAPSAKATLYVTVNGDEKVTLNGTATATYNEEASIRTGVAEDNNFLMSGSASTPIVANSSANEATVKVNRVAARIDEVTENKIEEFTFETDYRNFNGEIYETVKTSMTAEVIGYALYNLNKNTNIFYSETFATPDYFQPFVADKANEVAYDSFINKTIGTTNTYSLENNSKTNITSVIYKVQYKYDNTDATGDFFTFEKDGVTVLYKDFDSLDKDNGEKFSKGFGLNAGSTYDEFIAAGVTKYEAGIAYYTRPITTTGNSEMIARNNCYKLNVTGISGLGKAVVDPKEPGKPTLLQLTVSVMDWTINPNNFTLN